MMGVLVVLLVTIFFVGVFGFCLHCLRLSWAVSVLTGKKAGVLVCLVVGVAVLLFYVEVMRLLLLH
jgi:hypothetical protein